MLHAVMKHWHVMIGVDFHIPWPPASPSPLPSPVPYRTGGVLYGTLGPVNPCKSDDPTDLTHGFGITMLQGTDMGPLIPHVGPPSLLLPIEMVFSASKSYFGSSSTLLKGNKPVCCALLGLCNPNLNCGTPFPTPTGLVIALNTEMVSMSWGDILGGLAHMLFDFMLQAILNKLGNVAGDKLGDLLGYLGKRFGPKLLSKGAAKALLRNTVKGNMINQAARDLVARRAQQVATFASRLSTAQGVMGTAGGTVFSYFMGGPMGADHGADWNQDGNPDNFTPGGWAANQGGDSIRNYFNSPSVPQHGGGGT